jgi:hypothetical protein
MRKALLGSWMLLCAASLHVDVVTLPAVASIVGGAPFFSDVRVFNTSYARPDRQEHADADADDHADSHDHPDADYHPDADHHQHAHTHLHTDEHAHADGAGSHANAHADGPEPHDYADSDVTSGADRHSHPDPARRDRHADSVEDADEHTDGSAQSGQHRADGQHLVLAERDHDQSR